MGKAGASRTGVADMEGIPTPMPVGLLNRVQSLELKLEEVSQKCCRLEQENCSLRTWVQELQKGLKSAQKSFAAVEDLQQEVALMNADVASPKSSDSTGSRRGVMFRQRESIVEIDGRLANGNSFGDEPASRKVKSRKPTGYVAQTAKAAVGFEEYDEDVEEVEVEKTPKRKLHGRTPTAFVPKKGASPDVDFDDDAEDIEVEEEVAGPKRTVHGRKATAFVPKAKAPNVDFENEAEDVEEVEVDNTPHRKVKGRQPTAFVPKAPSHSAVDFRDDAEEFEGEETSDGAPKRAVHGRKATAFVKKSKVVGVEFEDEDEDVEEVEVETTPKRSVHGRQPTAFVPKSKARAGQVGFNDGAETVETEEDEETGPKRSTHGRKPTAFVPKSRAAPGVSFDDGADQVEVEQEGEMPTRSAHGRKPTAFVPKSQGVGFAADDDREAKAPVPKLPLKTPDGDGEDMSSPSKRGVRFRGNDSVNELDDHGEAHGHAVRKRVPTKFVAEAKVKEEDEDEHAHVSFADEVSESDEDGDEITSTPKLRPSRARVPTAFEKAYVPVEDDGSLTHEELQELNKRADQRPARPRLPTAFTQTGVAEAVQCLSPRMEDMVKSMPEHMKEIVDAGEGVDLQKHQLQGATKDVAFAEGILRKLLYFKDVDDLTIQKLIQAMEVFRFPDKTQVTRQGSIRGTHFFIVSKGSLVVLRNGEVKSEISQGAAFGENVILMSGGQDTTVQAKGEVEVYGLSGLRTRSLLAEQYQRERGQASSAVNEALSCESCWLLRKLTPYQMQCLFDKVNVQSYEDGAVLLTPGHKEHQDLHIILQGQVALSEAVRGDEVAMVERMGVIGYTGILYKEETFTAIAKGPVQTLILSSTLLQQMFGTSLEETIIRSRILMSIRQQEDLQHLRMDQLDGLASLYELVNVKPGETIERPCFRLGFSLRGQVKASLIKEGKEIREPVILKDRGKVLIPEDADIEADKSPLLRLSLAAGEAKNAKVAVWSGRTVAVFLEVVRRKKRLSASPDISPMSQSSEARQRSPSMRLAVLSDDKVGALRKVVVFRTLAPEQLHRLAEALEVVNKKPGEIIFNQGDSGKEFYIIHTGLLEVSIGGKKVRSLGMGDYVGERALLYSEPRSATVKVVEECELWRMGHEEFNQAVEGPICEYMKARIELQNTKVDLNSLTCLRVIGRGGFGVVKMVQSKTSGTRYALKCVSKKQAVEQKQQKALAHERDILAELDHPFIIKFVRSFNGPRFVYFLTELVTGGELLDALDALGLLQAPQAQFYSASIILAIEFLHERRIAYLDLKGENCLIDQHGYLKIIDFGVAERITDGRIYAVKGTPLFMAPEVILGKGYTTAADLWSLGVCLFDFMVGSFPFGDDQASNAEIFKAVLKAPLKFPKWLGVHEKDAKELMKQLLCRDPAKRLGAGQRGYDELKEHPFYADFRWDQLLSRQLKPPFTPQGETYAEDAEGGKDAEPGVLSVTEEDRAGEDDWEDPDPSWADEF